MSADDRTLNAQQLKLWRHEIAEDVRRVEYELAKGRAMLAWIDAEIRKLEEAG